CPRKKLPWHARRASSACASGRACCAPKPRQWPRWPCCSFCGEIWGSCERRRGGSGSRGGSERVRAGFAGADADDLLEVADEDLAVADLAGGGGLEDHFDHLVHQRVVHGDFHADLGQEVDHVL